MTMRAAIYARVSSAAQREKHTIDSQLRVLPEFCASRGWPVVGTFVDDGKSARTGQLERRDDFAKLMALAEGGGVDVVVVIDDDRLSRSDDLLERLEIYGRLKRCVKALAFAATGTVTDMASSTDELITIIKGWSSAEDNRKRTEARQRGLREALLHGRKPTGVAPYGLSYSKDHKIWSVDESRAAVLRGLYAGAIAGRTLRELAEDLNERGVASPSGSPFGWTTHTIWVLLRRTAYHGKLLATRHGITIPVPAIVDEATWHAAGAALAERRRTMPPRARRISLLEGIARCGTCGERMYIHYRDERRRYYVCATRRSSR